MLITKSYITLKKINGIILPKGDGNTNQQIAYTVNAEMMKLGYIMTQELMETFTSLSDKKQEKVGMQIINVLKYLKGADVKYKPMYPNFPTQVMEMSNLELYMNAVLHYWTQGEWTPNYDELSRDFAFENHKFREIGVTTQVDFVNVFSTILSSNDSISDEDKTIVEWFLDRHQKIVYPDVIPYKENLCMIAAYELNRGEDISGIVKTSTDILRLVTYISGGDVSLSTNTKFKSLPRAKRREIVSALEKVISEEDIQRHRNKWVKLFHSLHVGEYSKRVAAIAKKVRDNKRLETTAGKVQAAINAKEFKSASVILSTRPGEYARRLDHMLRESKISDNLVSDFIKVAPEVSTRVLMQLNGHFNNRDGISERVVFPKGNVQKAVIIPKINKKISLKNKVNLIDGIQDVLEKRFSTLDPLGKVYVEEALKKCPLPQAQRSSSTGLDIVARGTRIPFGGDLNTLRFFIYWVGIDIDLSASIHDKDFKMIKQISYTNLKSESFQACHSGDITSAPTGASEFIDITIDGALKMGAKYVLMNVFVYTGPNFNEHEKCYAGWMTREKPNSNEIYDPKTVENKIDLTSASRNAIPVVFDLETREAVWCDLATKGQPESAFRSGWGRSCNNIESNRADITQVLKAITNLDSKPTLYDLFMTHAIARGEVVDNVEEADVVFGFEGDVTPKDINIINSDYLI